MPYPASPAHRCGLLAAIALTSACSASSPQGQGNADAAINDAAADATRGDASSPDARVDDASTRSNADAAFETGSNADAAATHADAAGPTDAGSTVTIDSAADSAAAPDAPSGATRLDGAAGSSVDAAIDAAEAAVDGVAPNDSSAPVPSCNPACGPGDTCIADACVTCGSLGESCCPTDAGVAGCASPTTCAGAACTCIAQVAIGIYNISVRRGDGTVVHSDDGNTYSELMIGSAPLVASDVATAGYESNIGCAVVSDGAVWCYPFGKQLDGGTYLGAGLDSGTPASPSTPVPVITSSGAPLTGAVSVAASTNGGEATFCAVLANGGLDCWGYGGNGQLGRGDVSDANVAQPVLTAPNTPITGVLEVSLGSESICARKADGVYCWGTNNNGELGVSPNAVPVLTYAPTTPLDLGRGAVAVTQLEHGYDLTPCAVLADTSVVCWGYDAYGATGAPPPTSSPAVTGPTSVLSSAAGAAFTGVVRVAGGSYYGVCAQKSDGAIFCWGASQANGGPFPSPYVDSAGKTVTGVSLPIEGGGFANFGYVDPSGLLTVNGTVESLQPPCGP